MASPITERVETTADAADLGRELMGVAKAYPVVSLIVMGTVVVGGSLLVSRILQHGEPDDASGQSHRVMSLASASSGLGSKGAETLGRIRDAVFSFVFAKAVDTVEDLFPGFREHYERG